MQMKRKRPNGSLLQIIRFDLITSFPDFAEDDSGMEPIENSQWHGHVGDDDPGPRAVKLQRNRMNGTIGSALFQRVERPHGEIGHQEERDHFPARFAPLLVRRVSVATTRVQNK